ncbi:MAG TPA: ATP-binding protein, partial [Hyphomonadaceae bacterium]|nr:ATP-binding protein [Hyphomonadaceae bacterium]
YDVAFYAIRLIALPVSKIVLFALLWELLRLYSNLSVSYLQLRQERAARLLNAGTVIGAIAHEIRQPLAGINLLAYAGIKSLERPAPDAASANRILGETRKLLAEIKDGAARANEVFDTFLKLVRGGRRELQPLDVNALTLEVMALAKKDLDEHGVAITTTLAADLPSVLAHKGQIREVMLNLIQNSIEAMAPVAGAPRLVTITTARLGRSAVSISLRDSGPGIEPERLASIFDPFVTTKKEGTGLGLAICKMIIDQHDGQLLVENDKAGGAMFTIELPAGAAAASASVASVRPDRVET